MWWFGFALAAPCEPTALSVALDALDAVPDDQLARLTAADLAGACAFAPEITEALTAVAAGEPTDATLHEHPVLREGCPGLRKPSRKALWRACELDTVGLFSREDWLAADGPAVLPLLVHAALVEGGTDKGVTQVVVRRLAGVPRASQSRVVDVFEPLFPTFP